MGGDGIVGPEKRAYQNDARFRRFAEVLCINPPKLEMEKTVVDYEERVNVTFIEGVQNKQLFDQEGEPTKLLKEAFLKWNATKDVWRRHSPTPWGSLLAALRLAPAGPQHSQLQSDDDTSSNTRRSSSANIKILLLICLLAYIFTAWPLWKSIIDPQATGNYHTLGLSPGATLKDVKKAYRILAKKYHPDHQAGSRSKYERIREAYEELTAELESAGTSGFTDETKESNLQVLMFIGFVLGRIYEFSLMGSEFYLQLLGTHIQHAKHIHLGLHFCIMVLFMYGHGGSSWLALIINGWQFVQNIMKPVVVFPDQNHVKWETRWYAVFVLLPATVCYVAMSRDPLSFETMARVALGLVYSAALIVRHRGYVFLSYALGSKAYSQGNPMFNRSPLFGCIPLPGPIRLVVEVVIDDVLAYALHVPTAYRAACYLLLFVVQVQQCIYPQLGVLPWGNNAMWQQGAGEMLEMKDRKEKECAVAMEDQKVLGKRIDELTESAEQALNDD